MDANHEKRRIARIPITCTVVVREKLAIWSTDTEDIGARGCRIALRRPLAPGALVQLRFDLGDGEHPLEVIGQVVWARRTEPLSAGVAFVSAPRDPSGTQPRNWIDSLVAGILRRVLESMPAPSAALAKLSGVVLHLGVPPDESLDRNELAVIRLAREGVPLSSMCYSPEGLAAVIGLLDRGVVSVCRTNPDPEGWKKALSMIAESASVARGERPLAAARAGAVIVPPPPEIVWRTTAINSMVEEYLRTG